MRDHLIGESRLVETTRRTHLDALDPADLSTAGYDVGAT